MVETPTPPTHLFPGPVFFQQGRHQFTGGVGSSGRLTKRSRERLFRHMGAAAVANQRG